MTQMNMVQAINDGAPHRDAARPARRRPGRGRRQGGRRLPRHAGALRRVRRRPRDRHAALRGGHRRHRHRHGALRAGARSPRSSSPTSSSRRTTRSSASSRSTASARAASTRRSWSSARRSAAASAAGLYHSQSPESLFIHVAGLKVVCPSNPHDAKGLLARVDPRSRPGPLLRAEAHLPRGQGRGARGGLHGADRQGRACAREGKDVTVLAWGAMLYEAIAAADEAQEAGHRLRDCRSAHAVAGRHRHHRRQREEDGARHRRARGAEDVRLRRRAGRAHQREGVPPPRGAAGARVRAATRRSRTPSRWSTCRWRTAFCRLSSRRRGTDRHLERRPDDGALGIQASGHRRRGHRGGDRRLAGQAGGRRQGRPADGRGDDRQGDGHHHGAQGRDDRGDARQGRRDRGGALGAGGLRAAGAGDGGGCRRRANGACHARNGHAQKDDGPAATAVGDIKENLPGNGRHGARAARAVPAPPGPRAGYFNEKPLATPATRKLAREMSVDLRRVPPTGPQGRVTKTDVEGFATRRPVRRRTARRPRPCVPAHGPRRARPRRARPAGGARPVRRHAPQDRAEDGAVDAHGRALHLRRGVRRHGAQGAPRAPEAAGRGAGREAELPPVHREGDASRR